MNTHTITTYSFNELSDKAKEKAIAFERENMQDTFPHEFLTDDLTEQLKDLLKKNKITGDVDNLYYSLGYCQGDGAMFEGTFEWRTYTVSIKHSGRYYHSNSKVIDITDNQFNEDATEEVYQEFENLYHSICKTLEDSGYKWIEDYESDENIADILAINEYQFTEDGKFYQNLTF